MLAMKDMTTANVKEWLESLHYDRFQEMLGAANGGDLLTTSADWATETADMKLPALQSKILRRAILSLQQNGWKGKAAQQQPAQTANPVEIRTSAPIQHLQDASGHGNTINNQNNYGTTIYEADHALQAAFVLALGSHNQQGNRTSAGACKAKLVRTPIGHQVVCSICDPHEGIQIHGRSFFPFFGKHVMTKSHDSKANAIYGTLNTQSTPCKKAAVTHEDLQLLCDNDKEWTLHDGQLVHVPCGFKFTTVDSKKVMTLPWLKSNMAQHKSGRKCLANSGSKKRARPKDMLVERKEGEPKVKPKKMIQKRMKGLFPVVPKPTHETTSSSSSSSSGSTAQCRSTSSSTHDLSSQPASNTSMTTANTQPIASPATASPQTTSAATSMLVTCGESIDTIASSTASAKGSTRENQISLN